MDGLAGLVVLDWLTPPMRQGERALRRRWDGFPEGACGFAAIRVEARGWSISRLGRALPGRVSNLRHIYPDHDISTAIGPARRRDSVRQRRRLVTQVGTRSVHGVATGSIVDFTGAHGLRGMGANDANTLESRCFLCGSRSDKHRGPRRGRRAQCTGLGFCCCITRRA